MVKGVAPQLIKDGELVPQEDRYSSPDSPSPRSPPYPG